MLAKINVEVHIREFDPNIDNRYRLYMDNDLLIERKWKLDPWLYIDEEIWVDIPVGLHQLKLIHCHFRAHPFYFQNYRITDIPYNVTHFDDISLIFVS